MAGVNTRANFAASRSRSMCGTSAFRVSTPASITRTARTARATKLPRASQGQQFVLPASWRPQSDFFRA